MAGGLDVRLDFDAAEVEKRIDEHYAYWPIP
jgi:hypothetical protein